VIGQIAAKMSKTGVAGYIASFPIPEVVQGINSFMLGAQSINPDFKLKVVWVNTWFDPGKEADAAKALLRPGRDILTQHTDSTARCRLPPSAALHGVRPGVRHDQAFGPEDAADFHHRRLGSVLHRARQAPCWTEPGNQPADLGTAWPRATS
jgi:basic membrane protein A